MWWGGFKFALPAPGLDLNSRLRGGGGRLSLFSILDFTGAELLGVLVDFTGAELLGVLGRLWV